MDIMTFARIFPDREYGDFLAALSLIHKAPSCFLVTISPSCAAAAPAGGCSVLTTIGDSINISSKNTTKKVFIAVFREGNREKSAAVMISRRALAYSCFPRRADICPSGRAVPKPDRNGRAKER
ncbi:MAG: hypothetical protein QHH14_06070 [Clostridiales bacterium]|nr:hypothetical protein [Clostridiales bacterium]